MNRILIIEDEESVNRGIAFTLEKEGYEVEREMTIAGAKKSILQKEPQLILCDINLPDGNGLSLIRWIRKQNKNLHIICLTALEQEMDQVMGYEAGADDYITKPFSLSILMLKVAAFFKKQANRQPKVLQSGDIQFFLGEMRVEKEGEEVLLTKNEWKLLQLFLLHPKQILTKNQLLEQLFDLDGNFVDENTLAVNIRRLREKIEKDPSKPEYIQNIRGVGYIWEKDCRTCQE
ncbi:response regulator transcription factor [Anaerosporobacter faecicola]|uniref:response regulator transcription factor n=1 Tax=Anaerosporobacter faecicola TaxID=2718714 RepID=UPI00143CBD3E|nr:response regulator transcription factor [Anaerosporobacter faecicola]